MKTRKKVNFFSKHDGSSPREMEIEEGRVFQSTKESKEDIVPRQSVDVQGNVKSSRI